MGAMISPNFPDTKLDDPTTDDLIDVYEDRMQHWLLDQTQSLLTHPHGQPAAFCLLLTYFEGAWSYKAGEPSEGRSKAFFRSGFVDVFRSSHLPEPLLSRLGCILYEDARCGFFHTGMFRERIYFATMDRDMLITLPRVGGKIDTDGAIQSVLIDPARCYSAVHRHFEHFVSLLRDEHNSSVRDKFTRLFKQQCDWETEGPVIGIQDPYC